MPAVRAPFSCWHAPKRPAGKKQKAAIPQMRSGLQQLLVEMRRAAGAGSAARERNTPYAVRWAGLYMLTRISKCKRPDGPPPRNRDPLTSIQQGEVSSITEREAVAAGTFQWGSTLAPLACRTIATKIGTKVREAGLLPPRSTAAGTPFQPHLVLTSQFLALPAATCLKGAGSLSRLQGLCRRQERRRAQRATLQASREHHLLAPQATI